MVITFSSYYLYEHRGIKGHLNVALMNQEKASADARQCICGLVVVLSLFTGSRLLAELQACGAHLVHGNSWKSPESMPALLSRCRGEEPSLPRPAHHR